MPWIIDYSLVLDQLRARGLRCLYYNSGAFALLDPSRAVAVESTGSRRSAPARVAEVWKRLAPGPLWLMPKTHWQHEIQSREAAWLTATLERIGVDPGLLEHRTSAAAVEFAEVEADAVRRVIAQILLAEPPSEFTIAFPRYALLGTVGTANGLNWQTGDEALAAQLRAIDLEPSAGLPEAFADPTPAE